MKSSRVVWPRLTTLLSLGVRLEANAADGDRVAGIRLDALDEYWPFARVIPPALKPGLAFLIWTWAPSTGLRWGQ